MADYAIGDIQGCYDPLRRLLDRMAFDPERDCLWLAGDLVNRGSNSLKVLRFIKALPNTKVVLGNHDIYLLALAYQSASLSKQNTLHQVLSAPDLEEIITWLRHQPLCITSPHYLMVHAGLAPHWNRATAIQCAQEVEQQLKSPDVAYFLRHLRQHGPIRWDDTLTDIARWRCILYYFTQVRFCQMDGSMDSVHKGPIGSQPNHLLPWFALPWRKHQQVPIIFGHWAALAGQVMSDKLFALDTGCVWGNKLTGMRLSDKQYFSVQG